MLEGLLLSPIPIGLEYVHVLDKYCLNRAIAVNVSTFVSPFPVHAVNACGSG